MIQTVLCNTSRPDLPGVPIRFPIEDYADACTQLEAIGIGSSTERDCCVTEIEGNYSFLKKLNQVAVNVDELDYLTKRLDCFDRSELAKFQCQWQFKNAGLWPLNFVGFRQQEC